ncbi:LysR family transcriptional regulator [Streptomyces sp. NPDC014861]|uniref:LysR family transcriptional regulator n=1 Tax=Streptomyces sp. NPDC014861 TaxID=3364923 RepID=UPI0036F7E699
MDLLAASRAFVSVSEHGGFTVGATAAGMSQPVASRRVAALEEHVGERLFERTSRRAVLTPFGRDLLPAARALVRAADVLLHEAETARRRPWRIAVPAVCATAAMARLVADARALGIALDLRPAPPSERQELVRAGRVRAAVLAVPPDEAVWSVPLGAATATEPAVRRLWLETLRPGRTDQRPARRLWIQPEDDVPHIRDPLARLRDATGLRPAQLATATDLTQAVAEVLHSDDLLLCSPGEAARLGLHWRPLGELSPARGFALGAPDGGDPHTTTTRLGRALARCLEAHDAPAPGHHGPEPTADRKAPEGPCTPPASPPPPTPPPTA